MPTNYGNIVFCAIFSNFLANFAKCWHVIANTNSLVCCKIAFVLLRYLDLVQQSFEPKFLLFKAISRGKKILIEKKNPLPIISGTSLPVALEALASLGGWKNRRIRPRGQTSFAYPRGK